MNVRMSTLLSFHFVIIAGFLNHRVLKCTYFCLLYTASVFICGTEMHAGQCGQDKSTILVILLCTHTILCRIVYIPDCWGLRVITVRVLSTMDKK
jgi:O-antigen ligase